MKRTSVLDVAIVLFLFLGLTLSGCGGGGSNGPGGDVPGGDGSGSDVPGGDVPATIPQTRDVEIVFDSMQVTSGGDGLEDCQVVSGSLVGDNCNLELLASYVGAAAVPGVDMSLKNAVTEGFSGTVHNWDVGRPSYMITPHHVMISYTEFCGINSKINLTLVEVDGDTETALAFAEDAGILAASTITGLKVSEASGEIVGILGGLTDVLSNLRNDNDGLGAAKNLEIKDGVNTFTFSGAFGSQTAVVISKNVLSGSCDNSTIQARTIAINSDIFNLPVAGKNMLISDEAQADLIIYGSVTNLDGYPIQYRWLEGDEVLLSWTPVGINGEAPLDFGPLPYLEVGSHTLTLEVLDGNETLADDMLLTIAN